MPPQRYYLPPEWVSHAMTLMTWPDNRETWPGDRLNRAEHVYADILEALTPHERVVLLVANEQAQQAAASMIQKRNVDWNRIRMFRIPVNDVWIRDYGPISLVKTGEGSPKIVLSNWEYNAWGGKYPPFDADNAVPHKLADLLNYPIVDTGMVLEGGSVDVNGAGTLLTTESVLLNPNRSMGDRPAGNEKKEANNQVDNSDKTGAGNRYSGKRGADNGGSDKTESGNGDADENRPAKGGSVKNRSGQGSPDNGPAGRDKATVEEKLKHFFGINKVIWLKDGLKGDDTDGHIDDLARFVSERVVVASVTEDPDDPNYEVLRENLKMLYDATDSKGRPLEIIKLPLPQTLIKGTTVDGSDRVPASYVNFYIANNCVLVPTYDDRYDDEVLRIFQSLYPERYIKGIPSNDLVWGQGSIHCVTQQVVRF